MISPEQEAGLKPACTLTVNQDMEIEIPETSMLSSNVISKAPVVLPESFLLSNSESAISEELGIAVDLGTTTIAVYLCNIGERKILSSLSVKNPQALYGDDVMPRIGEVNNSAENLSRLQSMSVQAIEWGVTSLFDSLGAAKDRL